jgi:hypothetical protein
LTSKRAQKLESLKNLLKYLWVKIFLRNE